MTTADLASLVVHVPIGGVEVRKAPAILTTVLGSCVGLLLQDGQRQIAGLAHVVRPSGAGAAMGPAWFADRAVPFLRDQMLLAGAHPKNLIAHLCGGSNTVPGRDDTGVGARNVETLKELVYRHGMMLGRVQRGADAGSFLIADASTGKMHLHQLATGEGAAENMRSRNRLIAELVQRASR